ncbi:MAG: hypothetical protein JW839_09965 [Candidatus Lokiarchaeota archaeon]|nr:hypothetical protein [Candidatus Lokiarchaeota archaeon]
MAFLTFIVAAAVCFIQGKRKRNGALLLFGAATVGLGLGVGFQATSYMILPDSFDVALTMKEISVLVYVIGYVFVFVFVNYVWFERIRLWLLIPVLIIATLEIASLYLEEGLVPYYFYEGGTLVATSIGKTGYLLIFETVFSSIALNIAILAYITESYTKAPAALKHPVRAILLYVWLSAIVAIAINMVVRLPPNGLLNLTLYGVQYLIITSGYVVIIAQAIRDPRLLCILPFRVDRLLVIHYNSGLPLYEHQFSAQKVDDVLFSGLIQGLQQLSVEVLQKGEIRQIILESGVLTFRRMERFTIGLLASRSSQMLTRGFNAFTIAFEKRFNDALERFNGDRSVFEGAGRLVHEYFGFVPTSA